MPFISTTMYVISFISQNIFVENQLFHLEIFKVLLPYEHITYFQFWFFLVVLKNKFSRKLTVSPWSLVLLGIHMHYPLIIYLCNSFPVHKLKAVNVLEVPQMLPWIYDRIKDNLGKKKNVLGLTSKLIVGLHRRCNGKSSSEQRQRR